MALFNTAPTAQLSSQYIALFKWVKQYIESGNIRSKFDFFEGEEIPHGAGFEINVVLAASDQSSGGTNKAAEHGTYNPSVFTIFAQTDVKRQYAVTIDDEKLQKCTGDDAKLREYAAEIVDSLYQGWIVDKNAAVYAAISQVADGTNTSEITVSTDKEKYAKDILEEIKAKVMDIREGVKGSDYGNSIVGAKYVAASKIAVILSNSMYSMISAYGLAEAFHKEDLEVADVEFIPTNKMEDNKFIVTDARNIQIHKKFEKTVMLDNSDGSTNTFYNVTYRVDAMFNSTHVGAFPYVVINGVEE